MIPFTYMLPEEKINEIPVNPEKTAQGVVQPTTPSGPVPTEGNINQPQHVESVPPQPKRKFPKVLISIGGVFVGILVLMLVIMAISGRFGGGGGSSGVVWWGVTFDEDAIKPLIEEFEKENPGVSVNYVLQSTSDYRSRLTDSINKGIGPDIFEIHNSWGPMLGSALDVVPSTVMTEAEYSTGFYPVVAKDMTISGGFGGIPLFMDALTLFVNTEIFESEGRVYPITWGDLERIAKGLTKRNGENVITQSGVALGTASNVDYWEEILSLLFIQNGAVLSNPQGPSAEGAFSFYTTFSKKEGTWDMTMGESTKTFAAGKLAMLFAPLSEISEINTLNPSLKFRTIILPQIPKAFPDQPSASYANYWVESVNVNSKNKKTSWELLIFISEVENIKKLHENQKNVVGVYPLTEMSDLQIGDPLLGSVVSLLPEADSWYLYSETFDGDGGLNSEVRAPYKLAIDALGRISSSKKVFEELILSLSVILPQYAIK